MKNDLPLADLSFEEYAQSIFDISISPEEWAAKFSHKIGCSSFDEYCYRNKKLEKWIYKLHRILSINSKYDIDSLRKKYLTENEIEEIKKDSEF
ncbi:MAG: hypothetical protein JXB88_11140 [Spirochaetales bacterium]|nr:hypothetical protein [Spirochaetales bacterium]